MESSKDFFAQPSAAVIKLTKGTLKQGERIYIKGHTTDLQQTVKSHTIGMQVTDRVRPNDIVYKLA